MSKNNKKFQNSIPLEALFLQDYFVERFLSYTQQRIEFQNPALVAAISEEMQRRLKEGVKHGEAQSVRRKGWTVLDDSQKKQVIREYGAAVSPYGMIKNLAGKFDVSTDTISRIVNPKPISKEKKQD